MQDWNPADITGICGGVSPVSEEFDLTKAVPAMNKGFADLPPQPPGQTDNQVGSTTCGSVDLSPTVTGPPQAHGEHAKLLREMVQLFTSRAAWQVNPTAFFVTPEHIAALRAGAEALELLEWATEQQVDTIYLDDGRIIDIRSGNVTAALRAAKEADHK